METAPLPVAGKSKKQVIVFGILIIMVLALSVLIINRQKLTPQNQSQTPEANSKAPTSPFYSLLGEVAAVNHSGSNTTLEIKADWGQTYSFEIAPSTKILPIEPPARIRTASSEAKFTSQNLKNGQQVNITTTVDLAKNLKIKATQIKSLEIYIND